MAAKLSAMLLGIAMLGMFMAWQMQTAAGDALASARSVQNAEPAGGGAEAGSVEDYRAIVDSLDRSIEIRSRIDSLLADVEEIVRRLNETQSDAIATAREARGDLDGIGRTLGGSLEASYEALNGLERLRKKMSRSSKLGRKIADELEELDESLGPSLVVP